MVRIDLVFDVPADSPHHRPTPQAITDAATVAGHELDLRIVTTDTLDDDYADDPPDGVVLGPGGPYRVPEAAEAMLRTARETGLPLVGT